jgi:hypothetical protein
MQTNPNNPVTENHVPTTPNEPSFEPHEPVVEPIRIGGLRGGEHALRVELNEGDYGELNFLSNNGVSSADRATTPLFNPETMYQVNWGLEEVIEYLGADFRPQDLPADLHYYRELYSDNDGEPFWTVFCNNDDTIVDFPWSFLLVYSGNTDDWHQDPLRRRLTIEVGKGEVPFQCGLYFTESDTPSNINGNEVFVGYNKMSYGPYIGSGEQRTPAGYYDIYLAEFIYKGVGYFIEGENLTQEEFVNILLSIVQ